MCLWTDNFSGSVVCWEKLQFSQWVYTVQQALVIADKNSLGETIIAPLYTIYTCYNTFIIKHQWYSYYLSQLALVEQNENCAQQILSTSIYNRRCFSESLSRSLNNLSDYLMDKVLFKSTENMKNHKYKSWYNW